jgi:hypothetical protein
MLRLVFACALLCASASSFAAADHQHGRISSITFETDRILLMLDSGLPTNCAGTPYGWMAVPGNHKTIQGSLLGLSLRGDVKQVAMTVYAAGIDSTGFCQVTQIAPVI